MRKRLIAGLAATGMLMLVPAAPASAQSRIDPGCQNGKNAAINVAVDLPGLVRARIRLLCVNDPD